MRPTDERPARRGGRHSTQEFAIHSHVDHRDRHADRGGEPASKEYTGLGEASGREFSDATQRAIDAEVSQLISHAHVRAEKLLREHRRELDQLTAILLEQETVKGDAVYRLVRTPDVVTIEIPHVATAAR
jgi:hypothetical protein